MLSNNTVDIRYMERSYSRSNLFHQQNKNNHASKEYILQANTCHYHTSYTQKATTNASLGKFVGAQDTKTRRDLKVSKINQQSNTHFFTVLKAVLQFQLLVWLKNFVMKDFSVNSHKFYSLFYTFFQIWEKYIYVHFWKHHKLLNS